MSTSTKDSTHRTGPTSDSHSAAETNATPAAAPRSPSGQKDAPSTAGRIVHDSRGNAVWNWDKGADPSTTGSTSKMLKKLDLANLRVEDDAQPEQQPDTTKRGSGYGAGYNPYDRTAPVRVAPPKKDPSR